MAEEGIMVKKSDPVAPYTYHEEFVVSSNGSCKLFTCRWVPTNNIKALVFLCHGYGVECSIFMKGTGQRLAEAGYAVFGLDYMGHGRSEGRRCYIQCFDDLVNDCIAFFKIIRERDEYKSIPRFLYGESMGGAVALLIHRKEPMHWSGAVLVAPMCKISKEARPPHLLQNLLIMLSYVIPTWKIVPTKDIIELAFKDPLKRREIKTNPYIYQDRPRLKTALEMLNASMDLEQRLDEVTLPFIVLHGEDDKLTDQRVSQSLYDTALSFDKELKLYPKMWHGLTSGEPDDNIELVFSDIIAWLDKKVFHHYHQQKVLPQGN